MTTSTIYYFVDTNLFLQCNRLEHLDWSHWDTYEEVRLIVSSPVLREIDYRKNKGNDRAGSRARTASALFRKILSEGHLPIRNGCPSVVLSVEPQHIYSRDLKDRLNYQERDDQLVGTAYEFARHNPDKDVRLLTHDTTPLFTAQSLDLKADMIPDGWLLQPENSEIEKELVTLRDENARLKKAEPSISIRCLDQSNTEADLYCTSYMWFEPLTEDEVGGLMQHLKNHFPMEIDFGSRDSEERAVKETGLNIILGIKEVFTPATEEEIAKYRDEAYPQWLSDCERILRNHHRTLQSETPVLDFTFLAENIGTRPATDALVTIEAHGNFQIQPPPRDDQDDESEDKDVDLGYVKNKVLPKPPVAPCGQWERTFGGHPRGPLHAFSALARTLQNTQGISPRLNHIIETPFLHIPNLQLPSHDANAFYYKSGRPKTPQSSFSLECDQWRHDDIEEHFVGEIHVPIDQDTVKGALACRIQAANLSKPENKRIPVRIAITRISAFENAQEIVENLLKTPNFRIEPISK